MSSFCVRNRAARKGHPGFQSVHIRIYHLLAGLFAKAKTESISNERERFKTLHSKKMLASSALET